MEKKSLKYVSLVLGALLTLTLIVNTTVTTYVLWNDRQTASMNPNSRETLNIAIKADLGRPSPLRYFWNQLKTWTTAWYVEGTENTDAISGLTISVTGSNVASSATVDYYFEAISSDANGIPYKFLEGNNTSITVGGASLTPTNQTTIINHLAAMGLSTTTSHTIDYYVYVKAQATGAVSSETLTSEITKTKFDTVTYSYGTETTDTFYATIGGNNYQYYPTYYEAMALIDVRLRSGRIQRGFLYFPLTGTGEVVTDAELNLRFSAVQPDNEHTVYRVTEYWDGSSNKPTWNNAPTYSTTDSSTLTSVTDYWNTWDITEMAQAWGGEAIKAGIMTEITGTTGFEDIHKYYNWNGDFPPYITITWVDYSASWYQIPASVIDIPISQQVGTLLVVAISAGYILSDNNRRKKE